MGQKTHPVGLRLGIVKQSSSRWFADKDMPALLKEDELIVSKAIVNGGQPLKRIHAAAQGRATPIMKRTSHVEIHVQSRKEKD